jgi:hypothetical protein
MKKTAKVKFIKIDNDTSPREVRGYRDATNIRNGLGSRIHAVTPIKSTAIVNFTLPAGTNVYIGSVENRQKQTILYFIRNTFGNHLIIEFNPRLNQHTIIYEWSGFNWTPGHFIHSAVILDGRYLVWTDAFWYGIGEISGNEVRKIDLTKATNASSFFQYEVYIEGDTVIANTQWFIEYSDYNGTVTSTVPFTPFIAGTSIYQRVAIA